MNASECKFYNYYLESSLYTSGTLDSQVQKLREAGKTDELDGALWLKSTEYGDDKDRVMRKGDGSYTYFVPDVAYHISKWERGFERVVNIQGTDHHGTIARVRAGLQAAGVGLPHEELGQSIHALVQADGLTSEELIAFLGDRLVRYKIPRSVEFVSEPLRDDAGKVRRGQLRDEAIARLASV